MRTLALMRVSRGDQDVSLQRQEIEAYCRLRGWSIADDDWLVEQGVSGIARERPKLRGLLQEAERGRVGAVVVYSLDRLGRSFEHLVSNVLRLAKRREDGGLGVAVVTLRPEIVDFTSSSGKLILAIYAWHAEQERERLVERTKAGLDAARRRGRVLGEPRLVWTDEEIEDLRALRTGGRSLDEIQREGMLKVFDARGMPRVPSVRSMRRALAKTRDSGSSERASGADGAA